jgi:hypothetical protein
MTPIQIIPKGRGPLSRAIRELDARTRALVPGSVPGARVSRTPHGVTIIPTATSATGTKAPPNTPVWG